MFPRFAGGEYLRESAETVRGTKKANTAKSIDDKILFFIFLLLFADDHEQTSLPPKPCMVCRGRLAVTPSVQNILSEQDTASYQRLFC